MNSKYDNTIRRLLLYQMLLDQLPLNRSNLCCTLGISERTLDRDISLIRIALSEMSTSQYALSSYELVYDRNSQTYKLLKGEDLYDDNQY